MDRPGRRPIIFYITPSDFGLLKGDSINDINFIRSVSSFAHLVVISRTKSGRKGTPRELRSGDLRLYRVPTFDRVGMRIMSTAFFSVVASAIVAMSSSKLRRNLVFVRNPLVCVIALLLIGRVKGNRIMYRTHSVPYASRELQYFLPRLPKVVSKVVLCFFRIMDTLALTKSHCVICASPNEMDTIRRGLRVKSAVWIPFSVREDFFKASRDASLTPHRPFRVGYVGGFESVYDFDCLLEALSGVQNVEIHFVGDGPLREPVMKKCRSLNLKAFFFGLMPNSQVPRFLSWVDCLVECPRAGSLLVAQKTSEALAAGLAVVTTQYEALNLGLTDGYECVSFRAGDAQDLRRALIRLTENRFYARDLGAHARRYAFRFRESEVARQYERLILGCLIA